MGKRYCVYVHTNKTNGKRYVGITCREPSERWKYGRSYKHNLHFFNAIKKYGWDGFAHEVLETELTKEQACEREKELIALWDCTNKLKGYNKSFGGEGHESFTEDTRLKMSASAKRRFEDPHEIQKNREKGIKQFANPEAIEKDRLAQLKYHENNPTAKYRRAKAVNQYDLNGRFIKQWKSLKDAMDATGFPGIGKCCRREYGGKSSGGFMWRFAVDEDGLNNIEPVKYDWSFEKQVNQYTLDGRLVKQWDSITAAQHELKLKNISSVCTGVRDSAGGFMWRFAKDEARKQIEPYRRRPRKWNTNSSA